MEEELVKKLGAWVVIIVVLGSLVDIFQFVWILKRTYRKLKRKVYNKIRRSVLDNYADDLKQRRPGHAPEE